MASGLLGNSSPLANADTTVYTVPALTVVTFNIAIVNRGPGDAVLNVAVSATGTPSIAEFLEYGLILPSGAILERFGIVAGAGEKIVVRSTTENCSVRVHGFTEAS